LKIKKEFIDKTLFVYYTLKVKTLETKIINNKKHVQRRITMLEEMKEMIAEQLNCEESSITETTSFKDDLGADSLDLFELVMALEEKYEVEIPSEELAELTTVGAVMEYLKNKGVEA
jgi:acyl carrier protein